MVEDRLLYRSGNCVEVADLGQVIAVRDTRNVDGPVLTFSPKAWRVFISEAPDSMESRF